MAQKNAPEPLYATHLTVWSISTPFWSTIGDMLKKTRYHSTGNQISTQRWNKVLKKISCVPHEKQGQSLSLNSVLSTLILNHQGTRRCEYTRMQKIWWTIQYTEQIIILRKPTFFNIMTFIRNKISFTVYSHHEDSKFWKKQEHGNTASSELPQHPT